MTSAPRRLERPDLQLLLDALSAEHRLVGPVARDGAIVYDDVRQVDDLPLGWTDEQEAGRYRLRRREDEAVFGFAVGPHTWKKFLYPAEQRLWRAERVAGQLRFLPSEAPTRPLALLGVRACELAALAIQDRVFKGNPEPDPVYGQRRDPAFVVAVDCGSPAGTCFCVSQDSGPAARQGFDLALIEVLAPAHHFLLRAGSPRGETLLETLPTRLASPAEQAAGEAVVSEAAGRMGRRLDNEGLAADLLANLEHPRWDEVAQRCLTCANCTLVCPTCFCTTVEDTSDLTGDHAERWRRWDSCFSVDFSYVHGGAVRTSARARYRQWLTHKLATWQEQFGSSGCVGCGRCITWCPVGIDLTVEAAAIRGGND